MNRADAGRVIFVGPGDTVNTAYNRMRANEVSQLPVIDGTRVVGVLDEEDILAPPTPIPMCSAKPSPSI